MFLTETNLLQVVKNQYYYKLRAYSSLFFNMIVVQIVALLFSAGGVGGSSVGSNYLQYTVKRFSADPIIIFTLMWAFIVATYFTTKAYRNVDFTFVSNRLSSNFSNIAFLVTASIAGGVTASMAGYLVRVVAYLSADTQIFASQNFLILPQDLFLGMFVATLYAILVSALGYFIGMLVQLHRFFVIILPTLVFGTIILEARLEGEPTTILNILNFYITESSLLIFAVKVIVTIIILFGTGIIVSNRMEVRH